MDQQQKRDRRCIASGCTTTLSIYNSDHLCFAHADEASRARFESRWSARTSPAWYYQRSGRPSPRDETAPIREGGIVIDGSVDGTRRAT